MAHITLQDDTLTIDLSPVDKFFSMHGSFHVPISHVVGATAVTESGWNYIWNKMWGTNAPGLKVAGTYFTGHGIAFCDFGTGQNCIEIATQHEFHKKIIVELDPDQSADAVVAQVNAAVVPKA